MEIRRKNFSDIGPRKEKLRKESNAGNDANRHSDRASENERMNKKNKR